MKKIAMLDYETLGTSVTASLIAVGVVIVDANNPDYIKLATWYDKIQFDHVFNPALFNHQTLWWWMRQSDEVRACFNPENAKPLAEIFTHMKFFLSGVEEVWSKGSDFDIAMTKLKCEQLQLPAPWHYRAQRCYRTLEAQNPEIIMPEDEKRHTALEDADAQMFRVWQLYQKGILA